MLENEYAPSQLKSKSFNHRQLDTTPPTAQYKEVMLLLIITIQISVAVFFIRYLTRSDRGSKEPKSGIRAAVGFGLLALFLTIALTLILQLFPGIKDIALIDPEQIKQGNVNVGSIFLVMLLVGVIEEATKALPIALYIYKKPYFNEITDGIFYFGIAGITFSTIETIFYTLDGGTGIGVGRLIITPFLHTGLSMWFGYTLIRYKLGVGSLYMIIVAFISSMLLHGLYNVGMSLGNVGFFLISIVIAILLNVGVFLLYKKAQREDINIGKATSSGDFCRNCHQPNPRHTLFCEKCGQRT